MSTSQQTQHFSNLMQVYFVLTQHPDMGQAAFLYAAITKSVVTMNFKVRKREGGSCGMISSAGPEVAHTGQNPDTWL